MFTRCALEVSQTYPERRMTIRLLQARGVSIAGTTRTNPTEDAVWGFLRQQHEVFQYWGRWIVVSNSLSSHNYQIGFAPPQNQFWAYSLRDRHLDFVEVSQMTSGEPEFTNPLTLHRAWISNRGIYPFGAIPRFSRTDSGPQAELQGPGRAYREVGSFFAAGPVVWEATYAAF
jgi:hypothetical protein